jgi:hypothetical protein
LSVSGGTGTVTPDYDAADTVVTLTPTITRGGETDSSKAFSATVKSKFTSSGASGAFEDPVGSGILAVFYNAATTTDSASIKYKVCYSQDQTQVSSIANMDTGTAQCSTMTVAKPSNDPLVLKTGVSPGETWYTRVYAFIDGAPNTDNKKILYQLGTKAF